MFVTRARPSRRWLIVGGIGAALVALVAIALLVVYPKLGARMIRNKLTDRLGTKLGRTVSVGSIDVSLGHATIHDIDVRGPVDADTPLVHIDRTDVEFDALRSLVGSVKLGEAKIDGLIVTIRRDASGSDNVRDIVDKLRGDGSSGGDSDGGSRPTAITVTHARLLADDAITGTTALIADADARWTEASVVAHAHGVQATTIAAPKATVA
ncbi:MAG TPA: hypothetical protein VGO00_19165, partial [Kofleriaceae bacterium]|nr:hypothetical protein [Kofleriaceae bacterium]